MSLLFLVLAVVVTVVAAVRSTWSPCGVSMLSSLTPLSERGRGHRWGATAAWFVAGAILGGAMLGAAAAGLAAVVGAAGLTGSLTLVLFGAAALVAAASDARVGGVRLPGHTRQVNELWFGRYRAWVYGGGFGWQIGVGLATFITTAAVYVVVVAAVVSGSPPAAFGLCVVFGLVRGLAVLAGRRLVDPAALASFHRRFDALAEPSRRATAAVLAVVGVTAVVAAGPEALLLLAVVGLAVLLAGVVRGFRGHAEQPSEPTSPSTAAAS
ncbi:MAG: hypothetical protein JJU45_15040 [Acidimicrobiia bacterium]|nr:hypothetical protein [Acidimicrobiia bacterium]